MADSQTRSTFSSGWGAVAATAGVAIGLGNVWRFPYMMGKYGGSAFLLLYVVFVVAFGIPALMAEWSLGRHTRRGPWGAYQRAGMPFGRAVSVLVLVTVTMAASYYGVVVAWVLQEAAAGARGAGLLGMEKLTASTGVQLGFLAATIGCGCGILALGVRRGIERVSQVALPLVAVVFAVLIVRALTLEGAAKGLAEFLRPTAEALRPATALAALGQAIFSLGLGGMFMVAYGSYMRDEEDIPRAAVLTAGADLAAALMAGLIIVPAAYALSVDLESGPGLMFNVMPGVFEVMPAGRVFGVGFFLAIFAVAMLSLIAAYEVVVAMLGDALGWSRGRALVVVGISQFVLAIPAYIFAKYVEISDLIWGTTMQTLGAAVAVVALCWCVGRSRALEEMRRNTVLPIPVWLFYWIKFVMPVAILTILGFGWYERLR